MFCFLWGLSWRRQCYLLSLQCCQQMVNSGCVHYSRLLHYICHWFWQFESGEKSDQFSYSIYSIMLHGSIIATPDSIDGKVSSILSVYVWTNVKNAQSWHILRSILSLLLFVCIAYSFSFSYVFWLVWQINDTLW